MRVTDYINWATVTVGMIGVSILALMGLTSYSIYNTIKRPGLEEQLLIKADKNKDGVVSRQEMIDVYKNLGIIYNETEPRPLDNSDMERYLESSSLEAEKR